MVNNVQKAMPQYGVSQADVIFEIPVEGDARPDYGAVRRLHQSTANLPYPKLSLLLPGFISGL